ncbi:MAG: hypothetical protein CL489_16740 [Acidobacteria bacterium]|nr:hypothetical protein [Acidobacteriota bacterium]|tara:strand:- start:3976 stop:4314 length:339 start_codon:yes stop_codon:yes gene_type:complete
MLPTHIQSVKKGTAAVDDVQMVNGRTRLKGVIVCSTALAAGGTNVKLYNGTDDTGTIGLELEYTVWSVYGGTQMIPIPGNGILFDAGIFLSKDYSTAGIVSVTAIFQGGEAA